MLLSARSGTGNSPRKASGRRLGFVVPAVVFAIGANSVVLGDVDPGVTVIGSPARPLTTVEAD